MENTAIQRSAEHSFGNGRQSLARFVKDSGRWPELAAVLGEERDLSLDGLRGLIAEGRVHSDALADAIAALHGLPRIDLDEMLGLTNLSGRVSDRYLRANAAVPLEGRDGPIVAVGDPSVGDIGRALALVFDQPVRVFVAPIDAIDSLQTGSATDDKETPHAAFAGADDRLETQDIRDLAEGAPVVRALDNLFDLAGVLRATDIHIEPAPGRLIVRLRVDGMLRVVSGPPVSMARALVSRVKILAGLDIAERRLPQDGRLRTRIGSAMVDMRVATMPSAHGESAVLRLLSRENTLLDLPKLGMSPADQTKFLRHVNAAFGLVIVTGPTGSGKTTTLAAALSKIANGSRKIVTVEDPIEYQISSVIQTQVQPAIGLTFSRALRAYLRQDPDVMMIGEIRDAETAEIVIQAALTGHLVLSSLHTNTAAAAVARLLDMGVESYLLAATLRCVVGQRLVRRLCERCRVREANAGARTADEAMFLRAVGVNEGERFYRAVGCPSCNGIGYKSRVGVFEVMTVDEPVRQEIVPHTSTAAIETAARTLGMRTMLEDGLARCRTGETTVEEVLRVAASI